MFLGKGVPKICSKFTGEHPCRSAISIKLLCNFIEITLRRGCSPVNLLHIFAAPIFMNTPGWLLMHFHPPVTDMQDCVTEKNISHVKNSKSKVFRACIYSIV